MAKTAAQPKTMESNHKVASVLSTGLFAILCVADRISSFLQVSSLPPGRP